VARRGVGGVVGDGERRRGLRDVAHPAGGVPEGLLARTFLEVDEGLRERPPVLARAPLGRCAARHVDLDPEVGGLGREALVTAQRDLRPVREHDLGAREAVPGRHVVARGAVAARGRRQGASTVPHLEHGVGEPPVGHAAVEDDRHGAFPGDRRVPARGVDPTGATVDHGLDPGAARARGRHFPTVGVLAAGRERHGTEADALRHRYRLLDRHGAVARAEVAVLGGPDLRPARVAYRAGGQEVAAPGERARAGLFVEPPAQLRVGDLERLVGERRDLDVELDLVGPGGARPGEGEDGREGEGEGATTHGVTAAVRFRARRSRTAVTTPMPITTNSTRAATPRATHSQAGPVTSALPAAVAAADEVVDAGAAGAAATCSCSSTRVALAAPVSASTCVPARRSAGSWRTPATSPWAPATSGPTAASPAPSEPTTCSPGTKPCAVNVMTRDRKSDGQ